jgi:predicted RNA-binding Zn ribbon-like protein
VAFDGYSLDMFAWTAHRFSGGALALDLANTVVWSDIREKRTDRFADRAQIARFATAASTFRHDEIRGRTLFAPKTEQDIKSLLQLRSVIDTWLRPQGPGLQLQAVFAACARASRAEVRQAAKLSLGEACACSAMRFLNPQTHSRLKSCPSCHWLYLDNSKNQSRQWCDMKVCGNRAKARVFYSRHKHSASESVQDA